MSVVKRDRGPFFLNVTRRVKATEKNKAGLQSQSLPQRVHDLTEIYEDARVLLEDPRDTIISVTVWSDSTGRHVMTFRKEEQ